MPQISPANGIVATPHHVATTVGATVLREDGSAVDAAIAANAVLTVLLPDQTAIGGDCLMLVWEPDGDAPIGLNGSGRAPAAASADALRAQGITSMPRYGPATVTVPGTVDAWYTAHQRFGRLPMPRLLQPAADLARDGYPVSARLAAVLAGFADELIQFPVAASIFLDNGAPRLEGSMLRNPALASSLETIGAFGPDAFYRGVIAEAILATVGFDNGPMTAADLAAHAATWDDPIASTYRDATMWQLPPNTQGITAQLALAMLDRQPAGTAWDDPAWVHLQIEAKKRAFSIRDAHLGDPASMRFDSRGLLDAAVVEWLWADIDPERATPGQATLPGDTVFLGVIDADGLTVSLMQSIFQAFGSCLVAGDTGIVLQNRGSYFSLLQGHPNEIAGGKRPLHTLMPGMLDIPGGWRGAIGTQGGDAQAQVVAQMTSHLVDFGMTPESAVNAPRWLSSDARSGNTFGVVVESAMPTEVGTGLAARGHVVERVGPGWPHAGYAQIAMVDPSTGEVAGAADPRAEGSVALV